jgi:hypothetical protein
MKVTKQMTQALWRSGPVDVCPHCAMNTVELGPLTHRFGSIACEATCGDCGATWTQEYAKVAFSNLDVPLIPGADDNDGNDEDRCPCCMGTARMGYTEDDCVKCAGTGLIHPEQLLAGITNVAP